MKEPLIHVSLAALALTAFAAAPAAAAPPEGFTYFTLILGLDSDYSWTADCLEFTAAEVCTADGVCGTWQRTEPPGKLSAFAFDFRFRDDAGPVRIDGRARIEGHGTRETFAAAARLRRPGEVQNFGFTGRRTPPAICRQLVLDWAVANTPLQPPQACACLERASFTAPEDSPYILPYPVGKTYRVTQSYCNKYRSHSGQLAYDFDMPIGAEITAARAGVVVVVREDLADDSPPPDHNHVHVRHDDGSVAFYAHLARNGALVELDERVEAGQVIGLAAMSGTTEPHLHFGVYNRHPATEGDDRAVSFRNAAGPIDDLGGLIEGWMYGALAE